MKRDTVIQMAALVGLMAALAGSGALMPLINASASEAQLRYTDQAAAGAPGAVVLAQSVGVLRGVVVNYLWIRAERLKEEGKFFEAYHLAKWITQLQPRFAKVWSFQAWNMAYNISVATHTKEERWQWVNAGIRLLREQGLRYNPSDMVIYKELAWILFHKVSGITDDANQYYKQQWAMEWQDVLGEPPYGYEERVVAMRVIADAPSSLDVILKTNPQMPMLVSALKEAGFELDRLLLHTVEQLDTIATNPLAIKMGLKDRLAEAKTVEDLPPGSDRDLADIVRLRPIRENPDLAPAWPGLIASVRRQVLERDYNMDPAYMLRDMEQFGPLDWRSPLSHALYWAALGVERGSARENQAGFDEVNTDRIVFHTEQALKRTGRINYNPLTREVSWGPDLRFIPFYEKTYDIALKRLVSLGPGPGYTYIDGYRNFLIDCVREYYQCGQYDKAEEYYAKLRTPEFVQPERPDRFLRPIDEFIIQETARDNRYTSPDVARTDIMGLLATAFLQGTAFNDDRVYQGNYRMARMIYDYYMREIGDKTSTVTGEHRLGFPTWERIVSDAFAWAMVVEWAPIGERMALWERADNSLRLAAYDMIVNDLQASYEARGGRIPFDAAFPPPPGLEEYRKQQAASNPAAQPGDLSIERK